MIGFLIGVVALVLIPVRAAKGEGYRGAYIGWAIALFIAAAFFSTWATAAPPPGADASLIDAMQLMNRVGPGVTIALAGMGFGCLMGVAFYRPKVALAPVMAQPVLAVAPVKSNAAKWVLVFLLGAVVVAWVARDAKPA